MFARSQIIPIICIFLHAVSLGVGTKPSPFKTISARVGPTYAVRFMTAAPSWAGQTLAVSTQPRGAQFGAILCRGRARNKSRFHKSYRFLLERLCMLARAGPTSTQTLECITYTCKPSLYVRTFRGKAVATCNNLLKNHSWCTKCSKNGRVPFARALHQTAQLTTSMVRCQICV